MLNGLRLTLLAAATAGLALPQPLGLPAAAARQSEPREPLCRRPAPLPPLPPENPDQPEQLDERASPAVPAPVYAPPAVTVPPPPPPPPPPTPPAPAAAAAEGADVVVTGSRVERRDLTSTSPLAVVTDEEYVLSGAPSASSPPIGAPGYAAPADFEPRSGQLTAGDHDDLLNPELYARYVRAAGGGLDLKGVPVLDTRHAFVVEVLDDGGRPIPFAEVTLTCADGNRLTLATVADGTAVFFPDVDRLGGSVRVEVAKEGRRDGGNRLVPVAGRSADQRHRVRLPAGAQAARRFDLFLAVDTTGSMGDELEFVKSELRAILGDIGRAHPGLDIRVGLLVYRDEGDEYVTRTFPFTSRVEDIQSGVRAQRVAGGGDMPEAMDEALARAVSQDWRPDAVRALILVADAPPHAENMERSWAVAEAARAKRIQIVPVAASGVDDHAQFVMRGMAALTQSRYLFLTDDSGIGNRHAEPSVDCYQVTRLDSLVRRVLESLISGRRAEARPQEVIRSVGNYRGGRCLLPQGWNADG
ncbi:MAG TPA: VWA domain-containing protein, partial [Allosphingosinicella sp.]|jgi:Mg-chelatase subunit ChlD